ncbi:MFS transporter [Noviherbaspirillum pedocola]|uniref:MFS transporter n=1 Tax=Noviherbaspirillum pedocola TaxID=2801341 RepID=A0A934SX83_9BURK|nr:MFS transporter [Noviherbaspirillum pedocola]MBK4738511.1 MFS transporter [Noviherbaspirillum pedocola]
MAYNNLDDCSSRKPHGADQSNSDRFKWVVLAIAWLSFVISCVDRVAWSTIASPVGQTLGISVAMFGAFVTAFYVGYVVANIAGGVISDVLGARCTLTLTLLPPGILTFLFIYIHSLTAGIIIQFIMGLSAGADYSACVKILATWFGKDKGKAMGISATGSSIAVVFANAIVPSVALKLSWGFAFKFLGIMTSLMGVLAFSILRNSPATVVMRRLKLHDVKVLFRNRQLLLFCVCGLGGVYATVGFAAWCNALITKEYGISPVVAGAVAVWFGFRAVIAKPLLGWLSDLWPRSARWLSIGCLGMFSSLLIVFGQCSNVIQFYAIAPFLGAAAYGYTPLLIAQVAQISGHNAAGAAAGISNAAWQLGSVVSPLLIGYVYAHTHSFETALAILAVGPALGVLCLLSARGSMSLADNRPSST